MLDNRRPGPSLVSCTANPDATCVAPLIAAVRRQRAESIADTLIRPLQRLSALAPLQTIILVACAGILTMTAYLWLLSAEGITTPPAALLTVMLAAAVSSIVGFGFSAICSALLLHLIHDPVQVVVIVMVSSIAVQSLSVAVLWRDLDFDRLTPFLAGGIMGLPFGIALLLYFGGGDVRQAGGVLLTVYAGYVLMKRPVTLAPNRPGADAAIGMLSGIIGGLAGLPAALVTVWCSVKGWNKHQQRGIYQPFILAMQIMALGTIGVTRPMPSLAVAFNPEVLQFVPPALLGTLLGLSVFRTLSERGFTMALNVLLLSAGVGLLV
ncbi:MAG TPA: sulfite exporter TauE/SafE family protein [Rhodopila sp.]|nr:sulfite exporter TauE/SafE family protein [Rhodopila sp.]